MRNAEVFRLGFGEQAGLVLLSEKQIDIRRAAGLRIAVLAADENAWVYSPTPEIIFEQPDRTYKQRHSSQRRICKTNTFIRCSRCQPRSGKRHFG